MSVNSRVKGRNKFVGLLVASVAVNAVFVLGDVLRIDARVVAGRGRGGINPASGGLSGGVIDPTGS